MIIFIVLIISEWPVFLFWIQRRSICHMLDKHEEYGNGYFTILGSAGVVYDRRPVAGQVDVSFLDLQASMDFYRGTTLMR